MDYATRVALYKKIEDERKSKVLTFVTGDRQGMETAIAQDAINLFVDLLDKIGPTKKISLVLHTNGGQTLAAWRLINLIRTFCDTLEVLIPLKALSAGTLIAIGADTLVMTKQAALGPIDPSVNNPLNPQINHGGQVRRVPVSVEMVRGYLDAARDDLGIKSEAGLTAVLTQLSQQIHPLVIGEIFRSRTQIRFLANKLLQRQIKDQEKVKSLIDFLCADWGRHDYTINRREAHELGLMVEKPTQALYEILRKINLSYDAELKLLVPYSLEAALAGQATCNYCEIRGLVESTDGGCYGFVSEGTLTKTQVQGPVGPQDAVADQRSFEGWRKLH